MRAATGRFVGMMGAIALGLVSMWATSRRSAPPLAVSQPMPAPSPSPVAPAPSSSEPEDEGPSYSFRVPSGEPTTLSCADARRIVEQVRAGVAYEPEAVAARAFAESTADWLDPHELWALGDGAPTAATIEKHGSLLLREIEGKRLGDCQAAKAVGQVLATWVDELRGVFDAARAEGDGTYSLDDALRAPILATGTTRVVARDLAASLGRRVGTAERALGPTAAPFVQAARARFFPELDAAGWSGVVLAAAVRAYVPLVDPHGAWAPLDEEASVYEVDLSARPPSRLWHAGEMTALGFRVKEGAAAPLANGDVILSMAGVNVSGLPLEQLDQLGFAAAESRTAAAVVVRQGESAPRELTLGESDEAPAASPVERDPLPHERIRFGDGDVLMVSIRDVRDDLGDELAHALRDGATNGRERPLEGIVLDLRGNGGGSTDGAIDALGLFLPGAALFPMKRRDGSIETDRAPEPPADVRWSGPVATLVDGATASAAEMIAGALSVYRRGPNVGATTYGKGCAQEYVDDDVHAGVLRMTTLLYALPDGTPVQRVGLAPALRVPFATQIPDREATLAHTAPTWRGPDVRMQSANFGPVSWPSHGGVVGPCKDADVCRALKSLGAGGKRTIAAKR